jgi:sulfur-oxidizing protein SoxX
MRADRKLVLGAAVLVAGCAGSPGAVGNDDVVETIKSSFRERGIAKLDRLEQTELQKQCSAYATKEMPASLKESLQQKAMSSIKYPSDGKYLGDWQAGEKIAQSGRGLQFNDTEKTVAGGNCYACHELSKAEISYGNIGPSLHNYGKLRGNSEAVQKYTWGRIWNSHAFNACNHMPRFGAAGILTEAQIKDVMALLLDPASPVNK